MTDDWDPHDGAWDPDDDRSWDPDPDDALLFEASKKDAERLMRAWQKDDGVLDDDARARMWLSIVERHPHLRGELAKYLMTNFDPADDGGPLTADLRHRRGDRVGDGRSTTGEVVARPAIGVLALPAGPRRTAAISLLVVAALVAVVVGLAVTAPTRPDPPVVSDDTRGPTSAAVPVLTLDAIADRAAARGGPLLGDAGATYSHRVSVREAPEVPGGSRPFHRESWTGIDGNGRQIIDAAGETAGEVDETITDGSLLLLETIPPAALLELPTEPEEALARVRTLIGAAPGATDIGGTLVELLAEAGVPPGVRAALIRGLDALGFRFIPAAEGLGPAFEGPAFDGGTFVTAFDEDTVPTALRRVAADGSILYTTSFSEVELRPDLADG